jgi:[phosphatase 2A protein]-leucine-carboxy methyltransferase
LTPVLQSGPLKGHIASYVELDFAEITAKKAMAIRKSKPLSALLGDDVNVGKPSLKVERQT